MYRQLALALLILCCSANALTAQEKASLELSISNYLNSQNSTASCKVSIGSVNTLNIRVVPAQGDIRGNIARSIAYSVALFVTARHNFPDLNQMNLDVGFDNAANEGTMYCPGSWADGVRFKGDKPNADDLVALTSRVAMMMQTMPA